MRLPRFRTYLDAALAAGGLTLIWADDDQQHSATIALPTGARVLVKMVRTAAPGGDRLDAPERIVEGDTPPAVQQAGTPTPGRDGKVRTADVELYLRELIQAGGSREIARVRSFTSGEASGAQPYGLAVDFHSGATIFLLFAHTLPRGIEPSGRSFYTPLAAI